MTSLDFTWDLVSIESLIFEDIGPYCIGLLALATEPAYTCVSQDRGRSLTEGLGLVRKLVFNVALKRLSEAPKQMLVPVIHGRIHLALEGR
jgi:hypothetical protein